MQLTVQERFSLLNLLPREGDFTTLKVIRELRENLSFSGEEHELLEFKSENEGRVSWEMDKDPLKEFSFGRTQRQLLEDALKKADQTKKLTEDHLSVFEKFFPAEEDDSGSVVQLARA